MVPLSIRMGDMVWMFLSGELTVIGMCMLRVLWCVRGSLYARMFYSLLVGPFLTASVIPDVGLAILAIA